MQREGVKRFTVMILVSIDTKHQEAVRVVNTRRRGGDLNPRGAKRQQVSNLSPYLARLPRHSKF